MLRMRSKVRVFRFHDGDAAHAAELIPFAIPVPANPANDSGRIAGEFLRGIVGSLFRVGFGG